jgi:hypothetical protein
MSKKQPGNDKQAPETSNSRTPTPQDFTPKAIERALSRYALGHWSLKYSVALLLGALVGGGLLGMTELAFFAIVGTLGASCISWVLNRYIRAGNFEHRYVAKLKTALEQATERKLSDLKKNLSEWGYPRGAEQLEQFRKKFTRLVDVLDDKVNPAEITFARFFGFAQQVMLAGIDNLAAALSAIKSISEIDENYIRKRLKEIGFKKGNLSDAVNEEKAVLEKSLTKKEEQLAKVEQLMLENEKALALLDETTVAIANADLAKGEAQVDLESAMNMLSEITERSKEYSIK